MIRYIKKGMAAGQQDERDARIQSAVEGILSDITENGDEAVRRYSQQFDGWSPDAFRLSREEIDDCHGRLDPSGHRRHPFRPGADSQLREHSA